MTETSLGLDTTTASQTLKTHRSEGSGEGAVIFNYVVTEEEPTRHRSVPIPGAQRAPFKLSES